MENSEVRRTRASLEMFNMLRGVEGGTYQRHRSLFRLDAGFLILYGAFVVMYLWLWLTLGEAFRWYWIYSLIWIMLGGAMFFSARTHWRRMIEAQERLDELTKTIDALDAQYKAMLAKEGADEE